MSGDDAAGRAVPGRGHTRVYEAGVPDQPESGLTGVDCILSYLAEPWNLHLDEEHSRRQHTAHAGGHRSGTIRGRSEELTIKWM